jgi:hypothetical protein
MVEAATAMPPNVNTIPMRMTNSIFKCYRSSNGFGVKICEFSVTDWLADS